MNISKARTEEQASNEDADIDYSDIPPLDEDFWKNARIVHPEKKKQLTIRFDTDVVDWFKSRGSGYQSRMNAVLRAYVEAQRKT